MGARNARTASATFTRSTKQPDVQPEINVTPLVDVVLVLLIIFMVIAPALQEGVPVELPDASAFDAKKPDHEIEIALTADGQLHLEDQVISEPELLAAVRAEKERHHDAAIVLKADATLPYAKVRAVFAALSNAGNKGVSLRVAARRGEEET